MAICNDFSYSSLRDSVKLVISYCRNKWQFETRRCEECGITSNTWGSDIEVCCSEGGNFLGIESRGNYTGQVSISSNTVIRLEFVLSKRQGKVLGVMRILEVSQGRITTGLNLRGDTIHVEDSEE